MGYISGIFFGRGWRLCSVPSLKLENPVPIDHIEQCVNFTPAKEMDGLATCIY